MSFRTNRKTRGKFKATLRGSFDDPSTWTSLLDSLVGKPFIDADALLTASGYHLFQFDHSGPNEVFTDWVNTEGHHVTVFHDMSFPTRTTRVVVE